MNDTGGPAFPFVFDDMVKHTREVYTGMSIRDWFAGKAMQGLLAQSQGTALCSPVEQAAEYAYAAADAMLKERSKE